MKNTHIQTGKMLITAMLAAAIFCLSAGISLAAESTITKITCERDGQNFLASMISFEEFTETWKDVFVRYPANTCYYSDIENIANQLDAQRRNLRKAFYSCGSNVENLKKTYYELEAEIMYLRNFVSINQSGIKAVADDKVKEKMDNYFVTDRKVYTSEDILTLFDKFKEKYKDKVAKAYKECKDPNIQQLIQKWDQLVKTIKSFGTSLEKLGEEFDKAINTPIERTGPFIESFLDVRQNRLPVMKNTEQLLKMLQKDAGGSTPRIEDLQTAVQATEEAYTQVVAESSLAAKYDALYKKGTDDMALDFVAKLKDLNTIVKDTYKPIETITSCTKKTADRQCK